MLCQMALHHLLCSRLVTHPDKNSQALTGEVVYRPIFAVKAAQLFDKVDAFRNINTFFRLVRKRNILTGNFTYDRLF
jgi:hypothetical protein